LKNNRNLSVKVGLSIVLCSWLIYTIYWFVKSTNWWPLESAIDLILASVGTIGLVFRIGAVISALLAFTNYLRHLTFLVSFPRPFLVSPQVLDYFLDTTP
jgi:hypothetical protein